MCVRSSNPLASLLVLLSTHVHCLFCVDASHADSFLMSAACVHDIKSDLISRTLSVADV